MDETSGEVVNVRVKEQLLNMLVDKVHMCVKMWKPEMSPSARQLKPIHIRNTLRSR